MRTMALQSFGNEGINGGGVGARLCQACDGELCRHCDCVEWSLVQTSHLSGGDTY